MNYQKLIDTAKMLVANDKGLLAMDESNPTCNKRFAKLGIPQTEEYRRAYRELLITTPGIGEFISGAILYDETIRQQKKDGTPFVQVITEAGIIPGIKVDIGAKDMAGHPGETITEGLDGLRDRLQAVFAPGNLGRHVHAVVRARAIGLLGQRQQHLGLDLVDLVEHEHLGNRPGPDIVQHLTYRADLTLRVGV